MTLPPTHTPTGIRLLPPNLRERLWTHPQTYPRPELMAQRVAAALSQFGMELVIEPPTEVDAGVELPPFEGEVSQYLRSLALAQSEPYWALSELISRVEIPPIPPSFHPQPGWVYYDHEGGYRAVEYPPFEVGILDCETLACLGHDPVIGIVLGPEGWAVWLSPVLFDGPRRKMNLGPHLKLVVGHAVFYDRARVEEEYRVEGVGRRYLDTMSLHIILSGLSSKDKAHYLAQRKRAQMDEGFVEEWASVVSLNSLADCLAHYCGETLPKDIRDEFGWLTPQGLMANLSRYCRYCALDVRATAKVFGEVWPRYKERCPERATFSGMLELGSMLLTLSAPEWQEYIASSERAFQEGESWVNRAIVEIAEGIMALTFDQVRWNPWLAHLDWEVNPRARVMKGAPNWVRECQVKGQIRLTTGTRIVPYLLEMCWNGYPVRFHDGGWAYLVPAESDFEGEGPATWLSESGSDFRVYPIPHPEGGPTSKAKVGQLFGKNFVEAVSKGVLTSPNPLAQSALKVAIAGSYWEATRKRVREQYLGSIGSPGWVGIVPQILVAGTATRRTSEALWNTASNPKSYKIGSEIKALIQAPPGWAIVGADIDGQEAWLVSLIADRWSQSGVLEGQGITPLSIQIILGSKRAGTDIHSYTASIAGIDREEGKIIVYSRFYGAGIALTAANLKRANPRLSWAEATAIAKAIFAGTKGVKVKDANGREMWAHGTESAAFNGLEALVSIPNPRTPVLRAQVCDMFNPAYRSGKVGPSLLNWVVQSSGVDFLHLLIVAVKGLCQEYDIEARLALTIHDEVRYLVREPDKYRFALALQLGHLLVRATIAEAITGVRDLPSSVAWFSGVDIDSRLRKDPSDPCRTPSNPAGWAPGEVLTMAQIIELTGGQLTRPGESR